MNRDPKALEPYLDQLRQLPFVREAKLVEREAYRKGSGLVDAMLSVKTPTGEKRLPCEIKASHLLRETALHLIGLAREIPRLVILAPAVGRELGDLFQRERVNFLDLAGNCYLNLDDRYIARIQGRAAVTPRAADKELRAASYRVIFVLLVEPDLVRESTRKIAEAAGGVSPQTVNDVRERLVQRGILLQTRSGFRWALPRRREAFELWLAGFSATLFPRLLKGRFRAREIDPDRLEQELRPHLDQIGDWRWGGGAAAMRLTKFYRGEQTIVYFKEALPADTARRLHLIPDRNGPLALVQSPGPLAFRVTDQEAVHPLLVYADLLRESNDRASEAAHVLREKYLRELAGDE